MKVNKLRSNLVVFRSNSLSKVKKRRIFSYILVIGGQKCIFCLSKPHFRQPKVKFRSNSNKRQIYASNKNKQNQRYLPLVNLTSSPLAQLKFKLKLGAPLTTPNAITTITTNLTRKCIIFVKFQLFSMEM
jgi:hypothetical protein